MKRAFLAIIPAIGVVAASLNAGAQQMVTDLIMTQNGHEFVCTGVGKNAQNDPRWHDFPLKLVFARPDGAYLSDVSVSLAGADGSGIIDAHCQAPWFLARVAPGNYKAKVTSSGGQSKTVDVAVKASGQTQVVVTFNEG